MKTRDFLGVTALIVCVLGATSVFAGAGPFPNPTSRPNTLHAFVSIRCPADLHPAPFLQYYQDWVPRPWKVDGGLGVKLSLSDAFIRQGSQADSLVCRYGGPSGLMIYITHAKGCRLNSARNGFDC